MSDEQEYIFLFSREQLKVKKETEKEIHRVYVPKEVRVGGEFKPYTEKVTDIKNASYSDAVIVTTGKVKDLVFKN